MVIANLVGITAFLFLLWRTLKDDYQYEKIFNLGFTSIISFLISLLLFRFVPQLFWFWLLVIIVVLSTFVVAKKQKMKFFEVLDGFSVGVLPWISFYFLSDSIQKSSLSSFLAFWSTLICVFVYFLLKSYYRSFAWYKSGRVGFAGALTLLIYFVARFFTSLFFPNILTYAGEYEIYLSGSSTLLLGLLLYNLIKYDGK